jgi:hypothetical protein
MNVPRLPALEVLAHVIPRALCAPRFGRTIIGVKKHHVVLLLGANAVAHNMASRAHPARHLRVLNEAPELGVSEELVGRDDRTVGCVACIDRAVDMSDDDLADGGFHAVCADDQVAFERLAGLERD